MAFNSSHLTDDWCSASLFVDASNTTSIFYQVTLTACVVTSLQAPMAVVGNALIMAAIWRNPSLRTPSYVLLSGLAFTDFCTGLLSQPFFVMYQMARLAMNKKLFCIARFLTEGIGYYFSSLTVIGMTIIAVERWLHMRRRSLLTVRRIIIIYLTFVVLLIPTVACHVYNWYHTNRFFSAFVVILFLGAALCFSLTVFAYFKVFQIIRHYQNQVQTNLNGIDIETYKRSVLTILYILAIFLLSYVPYVCCLLVIISMGEFGTKSSSAAMNVCAAIVFSSSCFNPLLYFWRIKEIRDAVKSILTNLIRCKENREES